MYDVGEGQILYDDHTIGRILLSNLRSQISYVPQDVFLFSDTVRNNIRFGKANAADAEVDEAALKACIYNEIAVFADGMDTMVGERGVTLSGGQKQRISIARALIKDPNIVIFDDCLSAVDARTEQTIIANLYEYLQNKTAVIITHRIFALFNFDKIIVMHDGAIAEQGTHQQLLAQNGIYAEMFMRQQQNDGPSDEAH
jgi:ATP-binding cassette subfamily B protein